MSAIFREVKPYLVKLYAIFTCVVMIVAITAGDLYLLVWVSMQLYRFLGYSIIPVLSSILFFGFLGVFASQLVVSLFQNTIYRKKNPRR